MQSRRDVDTSFLDSWSESSRENPAGVVGDWVVVRCGLVAGCERVAACVGGGSHACEGECYLTNDNCMGSETGSWNRKRTLVENLGTFRHVL